MSGRLVPGAAAFLSGLNIADRPSMLRTAPAALIHLLRYEDLVADFAGGPAPFEAAEGRHDRRMVTLVACQRYSELMQRLGYADVSQLKAG
jgi:hypothetical protein